MPRYRFEIGEKKFYFDSPNPLGPDEFMARRDTIVEDSFRSALLPGIPSGPPTGTPMMGDVIAPRPADEDQPPPPTAPDAAARDYVQKQLAQAPPWAALTPQAAPDPLASNETMMPPTGPRSMVARGDAAQMVPPEALPVEPKPAPPAPQAKPVTAGDIQALLSGGAGIADVPQRPSVGHQPEAILSRKLMESIKDPLYHAVTKEVLINVAGLAVGAPLGMLGRAAGVKLGAALANSAVKTNRAIRLAARVAPGVLGGAGFFGGMRGTVEGLKGGPVAGLIGAAKGATFGGVVGATGLVELAHPFLGWLARFGIISAADVALDPERYNIKNTGDLVGAGIGLVFNGLFALGRAPKPTPRRPGPAQTVSEEEFRASLDTLERIVKSQGRAAAIETPEGAEAFKTIQNFLGQAGANKALTNIIRNNLKKKGIKPEAVKPEATETRLLEQPQPPEVSRETAAPKPGSPAPKPEAKPDGVGRVAEVVLEPTGTPIAQMTFGKEHLVERIPGVVTKTSTRGKKWVLDAFIYRLEDGRTRILIAENPTQLIDAGALVRPVANGVVVEFIHKGKTFDGLVLPLTRLIKERFGSIVKEEGAPLSSESKKAAAKLPSAPPKPEAPVKPKTTPDTPDLDAKIARLKKGLTKEQISYADRQAGHVLMRDDLTIPEYKKEFIKELEKAHAPKPEAPAAPKAEAPGLPPLPRMGPEGRPTNADTLAFYDAHGRDMGQIRKALEDKKLYTNKQLEDAFGIKGSNRVDQVNKIISDIRSSISIREGGEHTKAMAEGDKYMAKGGEGPKKLPGKRGQEEPWEITEDPRRSLPGQREIGPVEGGIDPSNKAEAGTALDWAIKQLGVDPRHGGLPAFAQGVWKEAENRIRTLAGDVTAQAHEIIHSARTKAGGALRITHDDLVPYLSELEPLVPQGNKYRTKNGLTQTGLEEGLAEYGRIWLTNYPEARNIAPGFTRHFDAALNKAKGIGKPWAEVLTKIQDGINDWAMASSVAKIDAMIETRGSTTKEKFSFEHSAGKEVSAILDKFYSFENSVRALYSARENGWAEVRPGQDPIKLVRQLSRMAGHISKQLVYGMRDFLTFQPQYIEVNGKKHRLSPYTVFRLVGRQDWRKFEILAFARRIESLWEMSLRDPLFSKVGITDAAMARRHLEDYFKDNEKAQTALKVLDAFYLQKLKNDVAAGLITQDYADWLSKIGDGKYVPMRRVFDAAYYDAGGGEEGLRAVKTGYKELVGSFRKIKGLLPQMIEDVARGTLYQDINWLKVSLYEQQLKTPELSLMGKIDSRKGLEGRDNVMSFNYEGKPGSVELYDKGLVMGLLSANEGVRSATIKIFQGVANTLRAGTTFDPSFWIRNFLLRDPLMAFMNTEGWAVPPLYHLVRSVFMLLGKDGRQAWRDFKYMGYGHLRYRLSGDIPATGEAPGKAPMELARHWYDIGTYWAELVADARESAWGKARLATTPLRVPVGAAWKLWDIPGAYTEYAPRVAEAGIVRGKRRRAIKRAEEESPLKQWTEKDIMIDGLHAGAELTGDFNRKAGNTAFRTFWSMIGFQNAKNQILHNVQRKLLPGQKLSEKEKAAVARSWLRLILLGVAGYAYYEMHQKGDPEYEAATDDERAKYFYLGSWTRDLNKWAGFSVLPDRIILDSGPGTVVNMVTEVAKWMAGYNKNTYEQFRAILGAAWDDMDPTRQEASALGPFMQIMRNQTWDRRKIVYDRQAKRMKHEWWNQYTPQWMRDLTKRLYASFGIEIAPAHINHAGSGYLSYGWRRFTAAVQDVMERMGAVVPEPADVRSSIWGTSQVHPHRTNTRYMVQFRNQQRQATQLIETLNAGLGHALPARMKTGPLAYVADKEAVKAVLDRNIKDKPWLYYYVVFNENTGRYQVNPEITKFKNWISDRLAEIEVIRRMPLGAAAAPPEVRNDLQKFKEWKRDAITLKLMGSVQQRGVNQAVRALVSGIESTTPPADWKIPNVYKLSLRPPRISVPRYKPSTGDTDHPANRALEGKK